ncbi:type VI secretion system protein TssA [Aromatoleum diolicum]|uniref:Type VI secretion system protein TssA n=1 Tax=Aromatoleum diolicum TaxID=75796 RepID=A0ABX1QEH1_9RHOO|nr:type VI secretion system protein TssA [Aromatoleum diolicum]NMG76333.1 type VI secretion system protein TssA [Aromatoleum diolicum]
MPPMDLDGLLRPLSGACCGEDLSFSEVFDEIQEARRFDDPSLSQGEWVTQLKEADWPRVARLCMQVLATRSKDIRLVVWLTEALAKTRGLAGLADGYRLLTRYCEAFWQDIHPLPDDGDQELRIGNLDWLLSQSSRIIYEIPLTDSPRGNFSMADLAFARNLGSALERNPADASLMLRDARVTLAEFDAARRDTPAQFFTRGVTDGKSAQQALAELERIIDVRLGMEGPGFGGARDALESVLEVLMHFAGEAGAAMSPLSFVQSAPTIAGPTAGAAPVQSSGGIQTRADALVQLKQVAEFFRRTEPHSPIAYLADKAARWGDMPLHEWLRTVVKDEGALAHVEELLGVVRVDSTNT